MRAKLKLVVLMKIQLKEQMKIKNHKLTKQKVQQCYIAVVVNVIIARFVAIIHLIIVVQKNVLRIVVVAVVFVVKNY